MRVSYSALNTYETCPLKYKYQYIDKVSAEKSEAAVFGSHLHTVLQYYHSATPEPTLEDVLDYYSTHWKSTVYDDDAIEKARFSEGLEMLKAYVSSVQPSRIQTIALEMPFQVEVRIDGRKEPIVVTGIIDRIDKLPDGRFEIIDYKTGKTLPSQQSVDENLQLSVYWMAVRDKWPKRDMRGTVVSLYYLKHGEKIQSRRTVEDIDALKRMISGVVGNIESSHFSPSPSALCSYCDFRRICPMMRHQFREDDDLTSEEIAQKVERFITLKNEEKKRKRQIKELSSELLELCDNNDLGRLFTPDNAQSAQRSVRTTYEYNTEEIEQLLRDAGVYDDVVKIDGTLLKQRLSELPKELQAQIEEHKAVKRESVSLSIKRS